MTSPLSEPIGWAWALVFGALISPTDPVAVLSTLKYAKVPDVLAVELQGEALFNDGVGVVLFTLLLAQAQGGQGGWSGQSIVHLIVLEICGGGVLGLCTGVIAYKAMKAVDDFAVEVLITLALVTGTYATAQALGMSGPLAVVVAGLLIGDRGPRYAMSQRTEGYVSAFWTLIDVILNAILFLLIGLEVVVLSVGAVHPWVALAAIPIVLLARLASVSMPLFLYPVNRVLSARNIPFLTWAGVRGGISVALALALPDWAGKPTILAATYGVVLFTILIQAPTLGFVARRTLGNDTAA